MTDTEELGFADNGDETPDFDSMDDKTFAEYVANRDKRRYSQPNESGAQDDPNEQSGSDRPDDAWTRSKWAIGPDDIDRQIAENAAARNAPDAEPEPIRIDELPDDLYDALGRVGTGNGTGQDRKAVRDAGLMGLVAEEYRA